VFNRLVAALLIVCLTACSVVPRGAPPESTPVADARGSVERQVDNQVAGDDAAEASQRHEEKLVAAALVAILLLAALIAASAAFSRGLSRHFEQSCCWR